MWTKNGSIPQQETDGTEGWIEVDAPPGTPEGKEVVWLNWEWVVRDPKPVDREGYRWNGSGGYTTALVGSYHPYGTFIYNDGTDDYYWNGNGGYYI